MSSSGRWGWQGTWLALALIASGAAGAADEAPRLINVTGTGEVKAQPDMAYVTLGIEARKPTLAAARAEVTTAVDKLLALAKELKVDPKHVDSTALQVQPEYRWNEQDSQRVLLGYLVSRQVEVELHDLERLGPLLERAVSAGANQVTSARLDSSRRKALEREALAKAVEDARLDAEALAQAAGIKLGAVHMLTAMSEPPVIPMYRNKAMMAAAAPEADQTYQASDMSFGATVSAQYELVVP
jgi:uncharacterized protein YggE